MAGMRRALTYVIVWGVATTLAMLLVWFAARPVLRGAVFGRSPARPFVGSRPSPPPAPPSPPPPADSSTVATVSPSPTPDPSDHTYATRGGRVVLALSATSARLISATPNPGYEVRTWHGDGWLRVDFRRGKRSSSLFAAWNDHTPDVQVRN